MCQQGTCDECVRSSRVLAGQDGTDGVDGLSVLSGTGIPDNSLGADTQYYIDKLSPFNFYLKSAGVWNYLGRLQGLDGNGFLLRTTVTIAAADILGSHATPVPLLPTLPSTVCAVPLSVVGKLAFNSVAYTFPANYELHIVYETTNAQIGSFYNSFITASSTQVWRANLVGSGSYQIPAGKNVMARINYSGSFAGDSPVTIDIIYYIYLP